MSDLFKPHVEAVTDRPRGDPKPGPTPEPRPAPSTEPSELKPERPQYPTRASLRGRTPRTAASTGTAPITRPVPKVSVPPASAVSTLARAPLAQDEAAGPDSLVARSLPKAVAAGVALVGALLIGFGTLQGTVFRPPQVITASLAAAPSQPIVASKPGLMGLGGPRVQVTASTTAATPVFLGIGRASDVQAYLAKVQRLDVTGEDGQGSLTVQAAGTESSLPDPGSADVWVVSQRARGAAALNWPDVAGQWVVVAATDGKASAPSKLTFSWSGAKVRSTGATFIAVGAVLLICGVVLLFMLISRSRLENEA